MLRSEYCMRPDRCIDEPVSSCTELSNSYTAVHDSLIDTDTRTVVLAMLLYKPSMRHIRTQSGKQSVRDSSCARHSTSFSPGILRQLIACF